MAVTRHVISLAVDASGDLTTYSDTALRGKILAIRFVNTDLAATTDITMTCEKSGMAVLTLTDQNGSATVMPRGATHSTAGAAALFAGGGAAVLDAIPIAGERLKVVVAQGGASKTGALHIYVES